MSGGVRAGGCKYGALGRRMSWRRAPWTPGDPSGPSLHPFLAGLGFTLRPSLASLDLAFCPGFAGGDLGFDLAADALEAADDRAGELEAGLDDEVEGLLHRLLQGLDDLAHLLADAAEADHAGQEADDDRHHLAQHVIDLVDHCADVAAHDLGHRVDHGLDELADAAGVAHEEHHHVVDQLARLDERGGRVQQADQPGDPGGDDLRDHEVLHLLEDHVLDVADLLEEHLPEAGHALVGERLEDPDALLGDGHGLLADLLHEAVADHVPRQPEDGG